MNVAEQIQKSIISGHKFIDDYANSIKAHYRVIFDSTKEFTITYRDLKPPYKFDDMIELSSIPWHKHSHKGWGKPDVSINGLEIRYLGKQFSPKKYITN